GGRGRGGPRGAPARGRKEGVRVRRRRPARQDERGRPCAPARERRGGNAAEAVRPRVLRSLLQKLSLGRTAPPAKRALVLAGGGVIGGMYEEGAWGGLGWLPKVRANEFYA